MITCFTLVAASLPKSQLAARASQPLAARQVRAAIAKALVAPVVLVSAASQASPAVLDIKGDWVVDDGSAVARVAPCAYEPSRLCAIVIQEVLAPGEESALNQIVVRDIRPTKQGQFSGHYQIGPQKTLPATIKIRSATVLEMKVCMGIFCDTIKLVRRAS
jgi:uncharacterized protein (DUF2147 family)